MTLPILPIPDTRPGYSSQVPGDVGALSGSIQAVLQALMQGQQMQQGQQQIDLQAQQVQQQGAYQRGQLANEAAKQRAAADKEAEEANRAAAVGQALLAYEQGTDALLNDAEGKVVAPSEADILKDVPMQYRQDALEALQKASDRREPAHVARRRREALREALGKAPPELRPALEAVALLGDNVTAEARNAVLSRMAPEQLSELDKLNLQLKRLEIAKARAELRKTGATIDQRKIAGQLGVKPEDYIEGFDYSDVLTAKLKDDPSAIVTRMAAQIAGQVGLDGSPLFSPEEAVERATRIAQPIFPGFSINPQFTPAQQDFITATAEVTRGLAAISAEKKKPKDRETALSELLRGAIKAYKLTPEQANEIRAIARRRVATGQ